MRLILFRRLILLIILYLNYLCTTSAQVISQKELSKKTMFHTLEKIQTDQIYRLDLSNILVLTKGDLEKLSRCSNLQELKISVNNWVEFPQDLSALKHLNRLEILNEKNVTLNAVQEEVMLKLLNSLQNLEHFNTLSIQEVDLSKSTELQTALCQIKDLTVLELKETALKKLPDCVCELKNLRQLYLSNNQLKTIPKCLNQLTELDLLKLSFNQLKQLPDNLAGLDKLVMLDLVSNELVELPESIGDLPNLLHLYVDYNQISELPNRFTELRKLRSFSANYNQIQKLPLEIGKCEALKNLYLEHNELNDLPRTILDLDLKALNLLHNPFDIKEKWAIMELMPFATVISDEDWIIPKAPVNNFKNLKQPISFDDLDEIIEAKQKRHPLYEGSMRNTELQTKAQRDSFYQAHYLQELDLAIDSLGFPNLRLDTFKNLTTLTIYYRGDDDYGDSEWKKSIYRDENDKARIVRRKVILSKVDQQRRFSELLLSLKDLKYLETLRIEGFFMPEFPDEICTLKQIKKLDLEALKLKRLPDCICELENLEHIESTQNFFKTLPDSIHQLRNLEFMELTEGYLSSLPKSIGHLKKLRYLILYTNRLQDLPEELAKLDSLEDLNVSRNRLKKLPQTIGKFQTLKTLKASSNYLVQLPKGIGESKVLEVLNVSNNQLQYLPEELANLENLDELNLSYNRLRKLPSRLGELPSLRILNLEVNLLESLPRSMQQYKKRLYLESNLFSEEQIEQLRKVFPDAKLVDWRDKSYEEQKQREAEQEEEKK